MLGTSVIDIGILMVTPEGLNNRLYVYSGSQYTYFDGRVLLSAPASLAASTLRSVTMHESYILAICNVDLSLLDSPPLG
jgi:hypothetical protein